MADKTKAWKLYESGKKYNNQLKPNYYDMVDANWAFFNGDQWRNVDAENMPKPVFNIIRRVITFLVASLTASKAKIHFEPLTGTEGIDQFDDSQLATAQVNNLLEKFKMDIKIKDVLFDAANTGDGAAHFYFDLNKKPYGNVVNLSNGQQVTDINGEICMELVDGTNVYFGNANSTDTQSQPYIIVSGRDMVKKLQEEKKQYAKLTKMMQDTTDVQEDSTTLDSAGDSGKIEVDADGYGKAQYIILYEKKRIPVAEKNSIGTRSSVQEKETVFASKSTEKSYIYEEWDTGMSKYPVAWMNWERRKNSYHGISQCGAILPNQIFINRMFAMVMYHLMNTAFPKAVYNADYVPEWNNEIGSAIPINGTGIDQDIRKVAGYLQPGNMSGQIVQVLELAIEKTKEMLGINDTSLGNVRPDNTSAIIAVQKSAAIPLENPKANLYQWIEDIGEILLDMMGTYYGSRPLPMDVKVPKIDPMTGEPQMNIDGSPVEETQKQIIMFDFSKLKDTWLNVRADVGESSYWSEIAAQQTLTNMLGQGYLDVVQFLKRVPDEMIPQKQELIQELELKQQQMEMQQQQQMQMQQEQQMQQQQVNADQQAQQEQVQAEQRQEEINLKHRELDIKEKQANSNKKGDKK
jgi:hypothetical protein